MQVKEFEMDREGGANVRRGATQHAIAGYFGTYFGTLDWRFSLRRMLPCFAGAMSLVCINYPLNYQVDFKKVFSIQFIFIFTCSCIVKFRSQGERRLRNLILASLNMQGNLANSKTRFDPLQ